MTVVATIERVFARPMGYRKVGMYRGVHHSIVSNAL